MHPECPHCHSDIARRISLSGPVERLSNFFSVYTFRCQVCGYRFRCRVTGAAIPALPADKRQFERLPTHVPATIVGAHQRSEDIITDLSLGGCTLRTSSALGRGAFVHLGLYPSAHEPAILIETAMVRSIRPQAVGLEFLEFEGRQKQRLGQFIKALLLTRQTVNALG